MRRWLRGTAGGLGDKALFILGINRGLRVSDQLALRIGQVIDAKGRIPEAVEIAEATLFQSRKGGGPIASKHAHLALSRAGRAVGLAGVGTRSLRNTFGYHVYRRAGGNLALVRKILNHRSGGVILR